LLPEQQLSRDTSEIAILSITKEVKEIDATCRGTISINHVRKALFVGIWVLTQLMALENAMIHRNFETSLKCVTTWNGMEKELQDVKMLMNAAISNGSEFNWENVV